MDLAVAVTVLTGSRADAVIASLVALGNSIEVAERSRSEVEVVIADATGDPAVERVLAGVAGATVVAVPGASAPQARTAACARTSADAVLLLATDVAISDHALDRLAQALEADPASPAAVPYPDPGAYVLVRRDALRGDEDATALVERIRDDGAEPATVAEAGALKVHQRVIAGPGRFPGAVLDLARPDALTAGTASYTGPGGVFKTFAPTETIELGAYCSIADNVRFINPGGRYWDADGEELHVLSRGAHRMGSATTFPIGILVPEAPYDDEMPADARGESLIIGDDVWIGYGTTVLGNVTVGTGSIIGACSFVRSDVAPYTVVGGNPAKMIRDRFPQSVTERLHRIGWSDWPPEIVRTNWWWFTRPVEEFIRHFDPAA
jgi:acetyltransferase-like isoleucine patch superfamily enzyme